MARGLGAAVLAIEAPFNPEGGAYAKGGHDAHEHDHIMGMTITSMTTTTIMTRSRPCHDHDHDHAAPPSSGHHA